MENIKELRTFLGEVMKGVKAGTIDIDQAKAIKDLGQTIVNSAKIEVDFIKAAKIQQPATDFISGAIIKPLENAKEDYPQLGNSRPKAEYTNNGHLQLQDKFKSA